MWLFAELSHLPAALSSQCSAEWLAGWLSDWEFGKPVCYRRLAALTRYNPSLS